MCVKKNAIKLLALKEPEQIFTRTRVSLIIDAALIILTSNGYPIFNLLSSIQARACLTLLHFNCNRAGLTPMGLHYLYIWAFGLSSWHLPKEYVSQHLIRLEVYLLSHKNKH